MNISGTIATTCSTGIGQAPRIDGAVKGGAIAPVPRISAECARFSTRECLELLTRSTGAVATGESQVPMTKVILPAAVAETFQLL